MLLLLNQTMCKQRDEPADASHANMNRVTKQTTGAAPNPRRLHTRTLDPFQTLTKNLLEREQMHGAVDVRKSIIVRKTLQTATKL